MKLSVNLHLPLILEYLGFVTDQVLKVVMSNLDNYYTEKILFSPVRGRILSSACGTVVQCFQAWIVFMWECVHLSLFDGLEYFRMFTFHLKNAEHLDFCNYQVLGHCLLQWVHQVIVWLIRLRTPKQTEGSRFLYKAVFYAFAFCRLHL